MSSETVHLLVLVHGMWGNPSHLAELHRVIRELRCQPSSEAGPSGERLEILLAETNRDEYTYDGIDWGGERVAEETYEAVNRLESEGKQVTRFSITGYSLGGLVSRYVVGILHQRKFFETVTPVNFNTIATPHIGLPRYRTAISSVLTYLGPKLLSRTGEQFWTVDKWSARGRPLLEVMADPERIFYQALCLFSHLRIYANAVNDNTVPYPTAAIEGDDIFRHHTTNGMHIELDEQYSPIIKSYTLPDTLSDPPPEPKPLSLSWMQSFRLRLPPALQFSFPYNIIFYITTPIVIPLLIMLVITRLSLSSHSSRARLKQFEKEDSNTQRLVHVLAKLERQVEDVVADLIDDATASPVAASAATLPSSPEPGLTRTDSKSGLAAQSDANAPRPQHVVLSDLQLKLVASLNTLPKLKKELAFIHPVRNSHSAIISRDVKHFAFHKMGEGVLRHWADHFVI
ncbi:hypothetical protein AcV5_009224 [Taiwanofungus camphoratus]|nr:hypothetical protein AcV5_009224 [Antrodia cinnamomea]KAI0924529.1 hypothetical protein AcW2_005397 [Antrodia cinnamomea]KAI0924530.1 hypothetical protein AcW2_005397 [Antrodia cinnamomea]